MIRAVFPKMFMGTENFEEKVAGGLSGVNIMVNTRKKFGSAV